MIIYSINSIIKEEVEDQWLVWMKDIHIPDIMKTGYFEDFTIYKVRIPSSISGEISYVIQYQCKTMEDYKKYSEKEAAKFQAEYSSKFIGRAKVARTVMETI